MKDNRFIKGPPRHHPEALLSRRTLLSAEQRTRLFGIPTDPANLTMPSEADE